MKKLFVILLALGLASCKDDELVIPSIVVRETCCAPNYQAEIVNGHLYKVGDTLRIQYNQMPFHEKSYPSKLRHGYTTVVIVRI
jgi:hypothetical protein